MTQGTHHYVPDGRNENILIDVNGEHFQRAEAKVSVFDSGFMLGDGVWEGIRLHRGRLAFLDRHLDRLWRGAKAIHISIASRGMSRGGRGRDDPHRHVVRPAQHLDRDDAQLLLASRLRRLGRTVLRRIPQSDGGAASDGGGNDRHDGLRRLVGPTTKRSGATR